LPLEIEDELMRAIHWRTDRLAVERVDWPKDKLSEIIERRLDYYSNGLYFRMGDLCAHGAKNALERLVQACEGSPRTLLRLCSYLLHHHVERSEHDSLIDHVDVSETLQAFRQLSESRPYQTSYADETPSEEQPDQGAYMDRTGHVQVDGQMVTTLSELEFRLLRVLYEHSPSVISNEDLIEAVWSGSEYNAKDADQQNLRKLIDRLRQRLNPDDNNRFIKNMRGRGYWLIRQ